jgi:hypothetical protein
LATQHGHKVRFTTAADLVITLDRAYGPAAEAIAIMDVAAGRGTLAEIVAFCRDAVASCPSS